MESKESVQHYLNMLAPGESFTVIFRKVNGEQRLMTGSLMPSNGPKKDDVPIKTREGIKSFNINRVLWIGNPQDCTIKESI